MTIALDENAIHIGTIDMRNSSLAPKLPPHNHEFMLLFDSKGSDKLPDNSGCDHRIELLGPEDKLQMGPVNQL